MDFKIISPLYECHGHIMMDGDNFSAARDRHTGQIDTEAVHRELQALKKSGVVYFRDGGDALGVSAFAKKIAPEYGIRYATPLFAIHRNGHYGGIVGRGYSDLQEYRELVKTIRDGGGGFVKIMISGIITFQQYGGLSCPSLDGSEIRDLVNIAHDAGFPVMIHVNGDAAVRAAVLAGADSIEHGAFMEEETVKMLADSKTFWVPTAAAIAAFTGRDGIDRTAAEKTLAHHLHCIGLAAALGARIASGSDSGAVGVPHGAGTIMEYRLLREAGVTEPYLEQGNRTLAEIF